MYQCAPCTTPTHVLQMPRAREAVGVRDKVVEADSQHRAAFTDLQARLNKRLNVRIFIILAGYISYIIIMH